MLYSIVSFRTESLASSVLSTLVDGWVQRGAAIEVKSTGADFELDSISSQKSTFRFGSYLPFRRTESSLPMIQSRSRLSKGRDAANAEGKDI